MSQNIAALLEQSEPLLWLTPMKWGNSVIDQSITCWAESSFHDRFSHKMTLFTLASLNVWPFCQLAGCLQILDWCAGAQAAGRDEMLRSICAEPSYYTGSMNMHDSDSLACGAGVLRFLLGCEHQERGSLATPSAPDSTPQHGFTNMSWAGAKQLGSLTLSP